MHRQVRAYGDVAQSAFGDSGRTHSGIDEDSWVGELRAALTPYKSRSHRGEIDAPLILRLSDKTIASIRVARLPTTLTGVKAKVFEVEPLIMKINSSGPIQDFGVTRQPRLDALPVARATVCLVRLRHGLE
jgi:hypothetical protein